MKRIFALFTLALMGAVLVGCEASARVGEPDNDRETSYKQTTIKKTDDGGSTKTEVKREVDR